uniref:uncharacterized protein LOC120336013 n=1 Tax=Styela clava TaxID=7725 RepID=UPI0019397CF7|nr:uncharacterized protein LOC120336013 [Styela clava]
MWFVLFWISLFSSTEGQTTIPTPKSTSDFRNYRLELFEKGEAHYDAKTVCEARNAWLVEIKDKETQDAVKKFTEAPGYPITVSGVKMNSCVASRSSDGRWINNDCANGHRYVCQSDRTWSNFNNKLTLQIITSPPKTFSESQQACAKNGSTLVEIKTDALEIFINRKLSGSSNYWTSGSDSETERSWKWGDGTAIDANDDNWKPWFSGEPNGATKENCLLKYAEENFKWVDHDCNQRSGYICQRDVSGDCGRDVCSGKGGCQVNGYRYKCTCDAGYFGTKCEKDLITISTSPAGYNINHRQSLTVKFNITSYVGNIKIRVSSSDNPSVALKSTTAITSNTVSTTISFTLNPFEVDAKTRTYNFTATPVSDANSPYSRVTSVTAFNPETLFISTTSARVQLKRGERVNITLQIESYNGNVNVFVKNEKNVTICSNKSLEISNEKPSATLTFSVGPIIVPTSTITYTIEESALNQPSNSKTVAVNMVVTDQCDSSPCTRNETCTYSITTPHYKCTCLPAYTGSSCEERRFITNTGKNCKYHVNLHDKKTFTSANSTCSALGGEVAMMKTTEIQDLVESQIISQYGANGTTLQFWIGGYKINNSWLWIDGTSVPTTGQNSKWPRWVKDPSDKTGNMILSSYRDGHRNNMRWYTNKDQNGYICEISVEHKCGSTHCGIGGTCMLSGCQEHCKCLPGFNGKNCETKQIELMATKYNYTIYVNESFVAELNVISIDGLVRIRVYKNNDLKEVIASQHNASGLVNFTIGPINQPSTGINYTFYASPESNIYSYNFTTFVRVVIEASSSITSVTPQFVTIPIEEDKKKISCDASGVPIPSVQWHKGDQLIRNEFETGVYQTTSPGHATLRIDKATSNDVGIYTCFAFNVINGATKISNQSAVVRGKILLVQSKVAKTSNGVASLTCTYEGYPLPQIIWKWHLPANVKIISNENIAMFKESSISDTLNPLQKSTSQLNITLVEYLGATKFSCSATNKYEEYTDNEKLFELNMYVALNSISSFHLYGKSEPDKRNYTDAKRYCHSIGKTLAIVSNNQTQDLLKTKANNLGITTYLYLGAQRNTTGSQKVWRWNNGSVLYNETKYGPWKSERRNIVDGTYVAWGNGRPSTNTNCLVMRKTFQWRWADGDCAEARGFICEGQLKGIPLDFHVNLAKCSSNFTVKWSPSINALGVTHRLQIERVSPVKKEVINNTDITPLQQNVISNMFIGLNFSTTYNVKVIVCPDLCKYQHITTKTITTDATIPGPVKAFNMTHVKENNTCLIQWEMDNTHGITEFYVKGTSSFVYVASTKSTPKQTVLDKNISAEERYFIFSNMSFNRNYTFSISARTCAGTGPGIFAVGNCKTERAAPAIVPSPIVATDSDGDGTVPIRINLPDESNGPISCIFVIVVFKPEKSTSMTFESAQDLRHIKGKTLKTNEAFVALAISRASISNEIGNMLYITRKLGDESTSDCNIYHVNEVNRMKREAGFDGNIQANNLKLENEAEYSYYVVTSTPGDGNKTLIKASEVSYFTKITPTSPTLVIIIIVVCVVIVGFVIIGIYCYRRKLGRKKMFIDDVNMQELQDNVNDDPLYANIAMDKMEPRSPYDIPLEQLLERYNRLNEKDGAKFIEEFQNLKSDAKGLNYPTTVASSESLKGKNRYKNILPSDLSRVLLDGEGNMSYINACYINGFRKAKKFIATQGPLPSTVNDFWRMIVEHKVNCIVMLTKCMENGKKKCEKYWPPQGSPKQFGNVYVENIDEIFTGCYKMFTLKITKKDEQSIKVVLLQYLNWPDHGVPVTTTNLMRFHGIVKKHQSNAPIVVHCSAGAGRTGAFIALDYLLQESESLRSVDVYNCILKLRGQRVDMVQTCDQYIVVHKLILENYLFGKTDLESEKFNSFLTRVTSDISILQKQFNDLAKIGPVNQTRQGQLAKQPEMNRNKEVIPFSRTSIVIVRNPTEAETPCLNASNMESYDNATKLIAAQGPLKQTIGFFWRAILDNNINTIVMLTECKENKKEQCFPYWPSDNEKDLVINEITIHLKSASTDNEITRRELRVTKEDDEKAIIQYQYTGWASNKCPDDATAVLELIEKMQSSVRRDRNSAVLVHCSDGAGRTGSYCAIINLIERLKCESNIDVFRTVKDLRDCRPGMVQTLDQYKFCFDAVSAYLSSFNLYANFNVDNKPSTSTEEENLYANI